jgi:hypothetical protein
MHIYNKYTECEQELKQTFNKGCTGLEYLDPHI